MASDNDFSLKSLDEFFSWRLIRSMPDNKFVANSYVWLIIVPVFTKAFSFSGDSFAFSFGDDTLVLLLDLPFSWRLFFLSALLLTMGNILYHIFCPFIVKEYSNFSEFYLNASSFQDSEVGLNSDEMIEFHRIFDPSEYSFISGHGTKEREMYYKTYCRQSASRPRLRWASSAFYVLGLALIFFAILSNIYWTFSGGFIL